MSNNYISNYTSRTKNGRTRRGLALDNSTLEMYQSFMAGYVRRINEATFNVPIGGIRIGSAKYSRLAQINLHTKIITFSRHAIENVPERGRRYLVIHELAHVLEASHNARYWELVGRYEPNYKQVNKQLDLAFKRNVREEQANASSLQLPNPITGRLESPKLLLTNRLMNFTPGVLDFSPEEGASLVDEAGKPFEQIVFEDGFGCMEEEFETGSFAGTISGGSPIVAPMVDSIATPA